MISSLSLRNFKAATADYTFERGNLIQGENFAGKSAIDQAIRCLVLGYVPGVAKTASGIKMFASDYPMRIGAHIKIGPVSERDVQIAFEKSKSTIKQTADETLAAIIDEPTRVLFDPSIFFGLSDSARISKACELVQSAGMKAEDIDAALVTQIGESPALLRHLATWRTTIKAKAVTIPDLLTTSEDFWKDIRKIVSAEKERMQSTVEGIADLNANDTSTLPPRDEVEAEKARATAELREVGDRIAAARALLQAIEADNARAAVLRPTVGTLEGLREKVSHLQSELAAAEGREAPLDDELSRARSAYDSALQAATDRAKAHGHRAALLAQAGLVPTLQKAVNDAEASIAALRVRLTELRTQTNEATAKLNEAVAAHSAPKPALTSGELRTDDFETHATPGVRYIVTATATVGAGGVAEILSVEDWKPLIDNAEEIEEAARAQAYESEQRVSELTEAVEKLDATYQTAEAQLAEEVGELESLREQLTRARVATEELAKLPAEAVADAEADEALRLAYAKAHEALRLLRDRIKFLAGEISTLSSSIVRAESAQQELAALETKKMPDGGPESPAQLEQRRTELNAAIAGYDATLRQISAAEQDQKRISDAATRRAEVEAEFKALGKVIAVITQKKTELVSVSIEAPLAVANKLGAGILKGPLVFEEGEVGMRVGTAFVSARVFSGTETAIVMMGLTAGLAAKSALRVLLLDEVGRLSTHNAVTLLTNLRSMVADGNIDQFFLIGPTNDVLADVCRQNAVNVVSL